MTNGKRSLKTPDNRQGVAKTMCQEHPQLKTLDSTNSPILRISSLKCSFGNVYQGLSNDLIHSVASTQRCSEAEQFTYFCIWRYKK